MKGITLHGIAYALYFCYHLCLELKKECTKWQFICFSFSGKYILKRFHIHSSWKWSFLIWKGDFYGTNYTIALQTVGHCLIMYFIAWPLKREGLWCFSLVLPLNDFLLLCICSTLVAVHFVETKEEYTCKKLKMYKRLSIVKRKSGTLYTQVSSSITSPHCHTAQISNIARKTRIWGLYWMFIHKRKKKIIISVYNKSWHNN